MKFSVAFAGFFLMTAAAHAAPCDSNFTVAGVPMLSAMSFKTFQEFPKGKSATMLQKLAQAVSAEGFSDVKIDKALSSIDASQETTGSGREQTLRVVARQKGEAVRVDVIFNIQVGQVTDKSSVRKAMCNILSGAR